MFTPGKACTARSHWGLFRSRQVSCIHFAMASHTLHCIKCIILMRLPLHTQIFRVQLDDCLNLLWDVKVVAIAIVQCSHELRMAQAPDFIAKLVDDISFLDAPAIAVEVF